MGRTRPPKHIRKQELKLAKLGTYMKPGPAIEGGQLDRPHFYKNPIALKRCTAKPTRSVWQRLGNNKKYDAFGFDSERIAVNQEDEFTEEEVNEAIIHDSDEEEIDEITIYDSDEEYERNRDPSVGDREISKKLIDLFVCL